ncbi:MAG: biopolymer transporter ExbD [Porticoccaceae bacterium]|nr:biopolymer transporter ExbD [Porticoccaceae bacterium]
MSQSRNRGSDEQQIDLTPMLDVVFIMLIFFIVTATFIKLPGTDVVRPGAAVAQSLKPSMLVAIDGDSAIWVDRELIDPKFLRTEIAALYADNPQGALVIQADEEAHVEQIALVADAAKEVGVILVQIAAEEG